MKLKIKLQNDLELEAEIEEWVAAVLLEMDLPTRSKVYERILKKNTFFTTPGRYVLKAEGGTLFGKMG